MVHAEKITEKNLDTPRTLNNLKRAKNISAENTISMKIFEYV
jgi:hypothetical protein